MARSKIEDANRSSWKTLSRADARLPAFVKALQASGHLAAGDARQLAQLLEHRPSGDGATVNLDADPVNADWLRVGTAQSLLGVSTPAELTLLLHRVAIAQTGDRDEGYRTFLTGAGEVLRALETTRPVLAQPVPPSRTGWRGPWDRRGQDSGWGGATGWTGEDWNFDLSQAGDGWIYGYGQGRPSSERRNLASGCFDVLFYVRQANGAFYAVGVYLNAQFLDWKDRKAHSPHKQAVRALKEHGIWKKRTDALQGASELPSLGKRAAADFRRDEPVSWRVRVGDVRVFDPPVPIPSSAVGGVKNHRFGTAYWRGVALAEVWLAAEAGEAADPLLESLLGPTVEGRRVAVTHLRRERDSAFIRQIKLIRMKEGRLPCEECSFDFVEAYGDVGRGYVEAHHKKPLGEADEDLVETHADDIALLCANCHRIAHRRLARDARERGLM